jgi:hypothetical protein
LNQFKNKCFITAVIFFSLAIKSQDEYVLKSPRNYAENPAKNAVFIELGGNSGLYSVNFDKIYYYKKSLKLSGRLGFSPHFNGIYIEQSYVAEQNFILFKNSHHLEIGFGLTVQRRYNEQIHWPQHFFWENILFSVWRCGYRYQKQDGGLFARVALTPALMSKDAEGFHANYFQFWAGASIGMCF